MSDKVLKLIIIGIISLIILSGFNTSLSANMALIRKADISPVLSDFDYSLKDDEYSKTVIVNRDKKDLLLNDIFSNRDSFKKAEFVPGEFIVKFKSYISIESITTFDDIPVVGISSVDSISKRHNVVTVENVFKDSRTQAVNSLDLSNIYKFTISKDSDILSIIEDYNKDPNIEYAEPNYIYHNCSIPNDPYFDMQWALHNTGQTGGIPDADIDAPEAWDIETGSSDVVIAVIDTGVDYNHPDLADNIWINKDEIPDNGIDDDGNGYIDDIYGYDFCRYRPGGKQDANPLDDNGHGTHCAGIASAVTNNEVGIAGVCWNYEIMSLKFLNSYGTGVTEDAVEAVLYAVDNSADVISMSWGGGMKSQFLEDALNYAHYNEVVLVASAGNSNSSLKHYPSGYDPVIAVVATDHDDRKASFSNHGYFVDVAAPGVDIFSTMPTYYVTLNDAGFGQDYDNLSGTSMACPHVAGLAGLLLSKNQTLTADMIKTIVCASVDEVNTSEYIGKGRINAYEALQRKPALAILDTFTNWTDIKGSINISGKAWGEIFQYYIIEYGMGKWPEVWNEINNSTVPVQEGVLTSFETTGLDDGVYTIRLQVVCADGIYEDKIMVVINNEFNIFVVDDDGGGDYTQIQEAVENAGTNDAIEVHNGTYTEFINIDRPINISGESAENTIIKGYLLLTANKIYLTRFRINPGYYNGIYLYFVQNATIRNVIISADFSSAIVLHYSNHNIISENIINGSDYTTGISLLLSYSNVISKNYLYDEGHNGISVIYGGNNFICDNTIINSSWSGIRFDYTRGNFLRRNHLIACGLFIIAIDLNDFINDINTSNTVNEKPLYYLVNANGVSVPSDAGEVILVNCTNCTVSGLSINQSTVAIELAHSTHNTIVHNNLSYSSYGIIAICSNNSNIISNNTIYNSVSGIGLVLTTNNVISNNNIHNASSVGITLQSFSDIIFGNVISESETGIYLYQSKNCKLSDNIIKDDIKGITIYRSNSNILRRNQMNNCGINLEYDTYFSDFNLTYYWNDVDTSNTINNKPVYYLLNETGKTIPSDAGQVILVNCSNCTITNLLIGQCMNAVQLVASINNTITANNLSGINAVQLVASVNNNITINNLSSMSLIFSDHNGITDNILSSYNFFGIYLYSSSDNSITNNIIQNCSSSNINRPNYRAIYLYGRYGNCNNNTLSKNTIRNIKGWFDEHPNGYSIFPAFGIYFYSSNNNIICDNAIIENNLTIGIRLYQSDTNIISDNIIRKNELQGIDLHRSQSNIISNNTIKDHYWYYDFLERGFGIEISTGSFNNQIYHNTFINNIEGNAGDVCNNIWDNGYPSGGNYWDDYDGIDENGDGIGDTPYDIPGGDNQDRYPLGYFREIQPPLVKITKPENALYIMNMKIREYLIRKPFIIGKIDIKVNATDEESGIERIEFYIDGKLKANITIQPYAYMWKRDRIRIFGHRHTIKVVAFDNAGNNASKEIKVWKFL